MFWMILSCFNGEFSTLWYLFFDKDSGIYKNEILISSKNYIKFLLLEFPHTIKNDGMKNANKNVCILLI